MTPNTPAVACDAAETARRLRWAEDAKATNQRAIEELAAFDPPTSDPMTVIQMLTDLLDRLEPGGGPLPAQTEVQVVAACRQERDI